MAEHQNQKTGQLYPTTDVEVITADEGWSWIMWSALILGATLIVFAGRISYEFVKDSSGGWSPDKLRDMTLNLRCIGAALFFAGYMERLILKISAIKS